MGYSRESGVLAVGRNNSSFYMLEVGGVIGGRSCQGAVTPVIWGSEAYKACRVRVGIWVGVPIAGRGLVSETRG